MRLVLLAGTCVLVSSACGGPVAQGLADGTAGGGAEAGAAASGSVTTAQLQDEPLFLVSRFGPERGVVRTRVTILTAFDPRGCRAAGECSVTIAGLPAEVLQDENLLEVRVPFGAVTGPLCVTWQERTECRGTFTVLPAPIVWSVSRVTGASGDLTLTLGGEGFVENCEVFLDAERLPTTYVGPNTLTAAVPSARAQASGERVVRVYAPSSSRCGNFSAPVPLPPQ